MTSTPPSSVDLARSQLLDSVWPEGRNPGGAPWDGGHYTVKGHNRPVSVSRGEALILASLANSSRVRNCFEIGTGFGYSASWIGLGLKIKKSGTLVTLDNYTEGGLGALGATVAEKLVSAFGVTDHVLLRRGVSPVDVAALMPSETIDLAFIDADHHGQSPRNDYAALAPYLSPSGVVVFHDNDASRYTVGDAVDLATRDGWRIMRLETSCNLTVGYKLEEWAVTIQTAFNAARGGLPSWAR